MPDYSNLNDTGLPGQPKKRGRPKLPRDANGKPVSGKPDDELKYMCCCCGKKYSRQATNFVTTNSALFIANGGYYPVCRECLGKYYTNIVLPSVDHDESRAVEVICGLCDWYWIDDLMDVVAKITASYREKGQNVPPPITYGQHRNMTQYKKKGSTYLDTIKQRWAASRVVQSHEEINTDPNDPDRKREEVAEEDVWFFGPGYTPVQYKYLREQYEDWCERYDCQSKAQEEIFKNLAIAQLNVQTAQQEGNQKRTVEAIKMLQDLMDAAKIKPKQKDDSALVEQNTFGTLIQKWENERPIPEPKEEWKDVDGIKRYISVWFYGHLSKMFGLDNDWSDMYEEEIAKTTVQRPGTDGADFAATKEIREKFNAMRGKKPEAADSDEIGGVEQ